MCLTFFYVLYRPLRLFGCPYFLHFAVDDGSVAVAVRPANRDSADWVVAGMETYFENEEQEQGEQDTFTILWNPEQASNHNINWNQYANLIIWFCSSHAHWSLS